MNIKVKRVYDPPAAADGFRVLVDRLWPRGISKQRARLGMWAKDVTPSNGLRTWFHEDPERRFKVFSSRYAKELKKSGAVAALKKELRGKGRVTFVTAAKDIAHSHVTVLLKNFR